MHSSKIPEFQRRMIIIKSNGAFSKFPSSFSRFYTEFDFPEWN